MAFIEFIELAPDAHQLDRIEHYLKHLFHRQEKLMTDVAELTQAVSDLEAQRAVDHQLITDLLAAVNTANSGGVDQATVDALTARVQAVTSGEKADDDAGNAALHPSTGDTDTGNQGGQAA